MPPFQTQDPKGPVVVEAPPPDENPGQVQDELRRVRRRPAGTRDPSSAQRLPALRLSCCQLPPPSPTGQTSFTNPTASDTSPPPPTTAKMFR